MISLLVLRTKLTVVNNGLGFIYFIFGFHFTFLILNLDEKYDIMLYIMEVWHLSQGGHICHSHISYNHMT